MLGGVREGSSGPDTWRDAVRNDRARGANAPEDQAACGECAGVLAQGQSRTSCPGLDVWLEVT